MPTDRLPTDVEVTTQVSVHGGAITARQLANAISLTADRAFRKLCELSTKGTLSCDDAAPGLHSLWRLPRQTSEQRQVRVGG